MTKNIPNKDAAHAKVHSTYPNTETQCGYSPGAQEESLSLGGNGKDSVIFVLKGLGYFNRDVLGQPEARILSYISPKQGPLKNLNIGALIVFGGGR